MNKLAQLFRQIPLVLRYGVLLAVCLVAVKTIEYQLFSYRVSLEVYTGLIAALFMLIGISVSIGWLRMREAKKQQINIPIEPLTASERKVLLALTQGLSNQAMADELFLSVNTVKSHLKTLYRKLGVANRTQAAAVARQHSLVD